MSIEITIQFFIFRFVNMMNHIDWFVYIEESLHPWDKPNLIMVYDLFIDCCILFARILLRIFTFMLACNFFFFVIYLSVFGIKVTVAS